MFSRLGMALRFEDTVTMEEMVDVYHTAYITHEGFHPDVTIVTEVANLSDHLDGRTQHWADYGISQYYQFHLFMKDGEVHVRGRTSTVGDEPFTGLSKQVHYYLLSYCIDIDQVHLLSSWSVRFRLTHPVPRAV